MEAIILIGSISLAVHGAISLSKCVMFVLVYLHLCLYLYLYLYLYFSLPVEAIILIGSISLAVHVPISLSRCVMFVFVYLCLCFCLYLYSYCSLPMTWRRQQPVKMSHPCIFVFFCVFVFFLYLYLYLYLYFFAGGSNNLDRIYQFGSARRQKAVKMCHVAQIGKQCRAMIEAKQK